MTRKIAVVLAAGKGTRMESDLPKVLVPVLGRPMIEYVLDALDAGGIDRVIVVVGYRAEDVRATLDGRDGISFVLQEEQLGTGHAVMVCRDLLAEHTGPVLVVTGDSPMMQSDSIAALMEEYDRLDAACVMGTADNENPTGLGRIIRDEKGDFQAIVEERDATPEQKQVTEVNMSCYVFRCGDLLDSLGSIRRENAQAEYYITDCPGILKDAGKVVRASKVLKPCEALSINTVADRDVVEAEMSKMMKDQG